MKTCTGCGVSKPLEDFFHAANNKRDGRRSKCKTCTYSNTSVPADQKRCSRCKRVRGLADFNANRAAAKGVQPYCRPCESAYRKEYAKAHAEIIAANDARKRAEADRQDLTRLKTCRTCGEERPLLEFYAHRSTADRRANNCKKCSLAKSAEWRAANREKVRQNNAAWFEKNGARAKENGRRATLRLYGLTPAMYEQMLAAQDGVCWICHDPGEEWAMRHLHVDHDHATNKVRGLLCGRCNMLLGYARDNTDTLLRAIEYLRLHST